MPQYQHMKTKYSVHSSLSKKCFDDYGELKLERIIAAEQAMATGQTEDGQRVGIPQELSGLIRGNEIRYITNVYIAYTLFILCSFHIISRTFFFPSSFLFLICQFSLKRFPYGFLLTL